MLSAFKALVTTVDGRTGFASFKNFSEVLRVAGGNVRMHHSFHNRVVVMKGKNGLRVACCYRGFGFADLPKNCLDEAYRLLRTV